MSAQQTNTASFTVKNTSNSVTIPSKRFISRAGTLAGAGVNAIGVADSEILPGDTGVSITGTTAFVEAGAAINGSEPRLMSDASGRAIPWTSGNSVAAILKPGQTAAAAGQMVEVIPILN